MGEHYICIVVLVVSGTICTQYRSVEGEIVVLAIMYCFTISCCCDPFA